MDRSYEYSLQRSFTIEYNGELHEVLAEITFDYFPGDTPRFTGGVPSREPPEEPMIDNEDFYIPGDIEPIGLYNAAYDAVAQWLFSDAGEAHCLEYGRDNS